MPAEISSRTANAIARPKSLSLSSTKFVFGPGRLRISLMALRVEPRNPTAVKIRPATAMTPVQPSTGVAVVRASGLIAPSGPISPGTLVLSCSMIAASSWGLPASASPEDRERGRECCEGGEDGLVAHARGQQGAAVGAVVLKHTHGLGGQNPGDQPFDPPGLGRSARRARLLGRDLDVVARGGVFGTRGLRRAHAFSLSARPPAPWRLAPKHAGVVDHKNRPKTEVLGRFS